jgi:hypothetical protein
MIENFFLSENVHDLMVANNVKCQKNLRISNLDKSEFRQDCLLWFF